MKIKVLHIEKSGYREYPYSAYLNGEYIDDFMTIPEYKEVIETKKFIDEEMENER